VAHSHAVSGDIEPAGRVVPVTAARGRRRSALALACVLLPLLAATIAGVVLLWPDHPRPVSSLDFAAGGVTFPRGEVTRLTKGPCAVSDPGADVPAPPPTSGPAPVCGTATVRITDTSDAGREVTVTVPPEVARDGVGVQVILLKTPVAAGAPTTFALYDVQRGRPLALMAVVFALVAVGVARLRGLLSLVGLGFAAVVVVGFMLPALVAGENPLWVGLTAAAAIIFVVLYLAHGVSLRTTTALLGTFAGLAVTAGIGVVAVRLVRLNGVSSEENSMLAQVAGQIDLPALLTCGIVLAGLGVLNDVTITQASAVWELREAAPGMAPRRLYRTAMRIGRDHIASTVYTIVFAYAGAALPVLLLIELYAQPLGSVLTSADIAEELVRTMASAIGLVLAVPITTGLAVAVATAGGRSAHPTVSAESAHTRGTTG